MPVNQPRARGIAAASLTVAVAVAATPGVATAGSVAIGAAADNSLYEDDAGALSNGAGEFLFAGRTGMGLIRRGLIRFDLEGLIPVGATIDSVTLTLQKGTSNIEPESLTLHRVLAGWGEAGSDAPGGEGGGAPAMPGDATWLHMEYDTSVWANPGGDFEAIASATTVVGDLGGYDWSSAAMIDDVAGWLDDPGTNFGWALRGNEVTSGTTKKFGTRDHLDPAMRPELVIEFTTIPAPPTLGLLLLAGLGGRRLTGRRRR